MRVHFKIDFSTTTLRFPDANTGWVTMRRTVGLRTSAAGVGGDKLAARARPEALKAAARAGENGGGSERDQGHQERVFDKVLTTLVMEKASGCHKEVLHNQSL